MHNATEQKQPTREEQLRLLLEEAAKQPGIADLMQLQKQSWYQLAVTSGQPITRAIRRTSVSTDSIASAF